MRPYRLLLLELGFLEAFPYLSLLLEVPGVGLEMSFNYEPVLSRPRDEKFLRFWVKQIVR